jgi:hypothetical protein
MKDTTALMLLHGDPNMTNSHDLSRDLPHDLPHDLNDQKKRKFFHTINHAITNEQPLFASKFNQKDLLDLVAHTILLQVQEHSEHLQQPDVITSSQLVWNPSENCYIKIPKDDTDLRIALSSAQEFVDFYSSADFLATQAVHSTAPSIDPYSLFQKNSVWQSLSVELRSVIEHSIGPFSNRYLIQTPPPSTSSTPSPQYFSVVPMEVDQEI